MVYYGFTYDLFIPGEFLVWLEALSELLNYSSDQGSTNPTQMISLAYFTFYNSLFRSKIRRPKSGGSDPSHVIPLEEIRKVIIQEKLFLNSNLKVKDLAEKLSLPPHVISRMLNSHFNITFNDLINEIRIKYAEKLLVSTNDKLYAIALDSGFSNKVSFITNFKKFNNITPTSFRRRVLKRISEGGLNLNGAS